MRTGNTTRAVGTAGSLAIGTEGRNRSRRDLRELQISRRWILAMSRGYV